ncbi:MAG: aromatic ring-hydroxylating dioxygenase subunit alpha [Pseudomonadales bacterium]|nr:aromatic ring-hydroxylating dioxygenase subunit alpha [Pseudomonadales bacterium]
MTAHGKESNKQKVHEVWPADKPLTGLKASVEDEDYKRLVPKQRFTSKEWLQKEYKLLWPRVWQWACREDEVPEIGDFFEYKIGDQSIIVVRTDDGSLKAYHNVCKHRGTRLLEGEHWWGGKGTTRNFRDMFNGKIRCVFHGWAWDLDGDIAFLPGAKDFAPERIQKDEIALSPVRCETWEGFVYINMDMDAEPLLDYLQPGPERLKKFNIGKMKLKAHFTTILPCNWKYGVEQFQEGYHVWATHVMDLNDVGNFATRPGGRRVGAMYAFEGAKPTVNEKAPDPDLIGAHTVTEQFDIHTNFTEPDPTVQTGLPPRVKLKDLVDEERPEPREWIKEAMRNMVSQNRLADYEMEYFEGLSHDDIPWDMEGPAFMMKNRRDSCAAKGIDLSHLEDNELFGFAQEFRFFPNHIGPIAGNSYGLFRSRPNGDDPNSCIWDMMFMFQYAEGEEPETHYETVDWENASGDRMPETFLQDWKTTPKFQAGMHSIALKGCRFNKQEANALHTHKLLDIIIGRDFEDLEAE